MRRVAELDALRGLAALAIVFYHLWLIRFPILGTAVDLFFVLSGYLITTIILEHQGTPGFLGAFYARRALRIWPIYYLSLLALLAINPWLAPPARLDGFWQYATYTQKAQLYWFGDEPPFNPAFRHTWTLAIEEQFYILWPALVIWAGRRHLILLASLIAAVSVGTRALGFAPWILLSHADGLALGGLLAAVLADREAVARRRGSYGLGFGATTLGALAGMAASKLLGGRLGPDWAPAFGSVQLFAISVLYLGLVGLVVVHAGRPALAPLRDARLVGLGVISYGLYLYHHILFAMLPDAPDGPGRWLWDVAKLLACLALAIASWHLVERPILALKDRFSYRPRPEPESTPTPTAGRWAGEGA